MSEIIDLTGLSSPARFGPPELVDLTGPTPEADRTPAQPFSMRDAGNVEPVDTPLAFARILADDVSLPSLPANLDMDMLEEEEYQPVKRPRCEVWLAQCENARERCRTAYNPVRHTPWMVQYGYPNRIWQAVGEEKYN